MFCVNRWRKKIVFFLEVSFRHSTLSFDVTMAQSFDVNQHVSERGFGMLQGVEICLIEYVLNLN